MVVLIRMDYNVLVVYYASTLCSSVAPVASSNSEVAAQSLNDSVQQLLTSFMDNARSRLEHEVCVSVCMYVYIMCVHACVYVCVFMCMCVCSVFIRVCVCMHMCVFVCMYAWVWVLFMCMCLHVYLYVCIFVCVRM